MDLLWTVPPMAFAIGAVALIHLRGVAEAASALQVELRRFSEVHVQVTEARSASAAARATARCDRR